MKTHEKSLSVEFEQYPPTEFDADEVSRHKGKTVINAVRDLMAGKYPDVRRQIVSGGCYDVESSRHSENVPCEVPVRSDARWDDIADQCQNQRMSLAVAEHVRGGTML